MEEHSSDQINHIGNLINSLMEDYGMIGSEINENFYSDVNEGKSATYSLNDPYDLINLEIHYEMSEVYLHIEYLLVDGLPIQWLREIAEKNGVDHYN